MFFNSKKCIKRNRCVLMRPFRNLVFIFTYVRMVMMEAEKQLKHLNFSV